VITLFTIPKPFTGHIDIIQRNAIQSWLRLQPACEIILFSNDYSVEKVAKEYGCKYLPDLPINQFNTPYLNKAFEIAEKIAKNQFLCYVNTDIILTQDVIKSVEEVNKSFKKFLIVGGRWNVDILAPLDFNDSYWVKQVQKAAITANILSAHAGSDYFIFPKNTIGPLKEFLVGRPGWDNWMFFHARSLNIPLIDATKSIYDIHQNHTYKHIKKGNGNVWEGPEADYNRSLIPREKLFNLYDATHIVNEYFTVEKSLEVHILKQRIKRYPILHPSKGVKRWIQSKLLNLCIKFINFCSCRIKGVYWRKLIYWLTK